MAPKYLSKQGTSAQRGLGLGAALIILLVLALITAVVTLGRWYARPLPMPAERVEVRVASGAHTRAIARSLVQAGLDLNEEAFVAAAKIAGATQSLRAGRYEFTRGMNVQEVIEKLRRGEVMRERFTLIEGWNVRDMRAALRQSKDLKADRNAASDAALLKAVGAEQTNAEGLFAPDTYVFDPGSSDLELLKVAYRAQMARLTQAWDSRAPNLPYKTPYEALIMASIVEKETGQGGERAQIAGVFVNRLRKGMPLQTDPTVIYGLGAAFDGNLRKRDLQTDGPYNSYMRGGLPPTPIAMPSRASIQAALNPTDTRALYFVARGDGTSHFSETLSEHSRAVARYQLQGAR